MAEPQKKARTITLPDGRTIDIDPSAPPEAVAQTVLQLWKPPEAAAEEAGSAPSRFMSSLAENVDPRPIIQALSSPVQTFRTLAQNAPPATGGPLTDNPIAAGLRGMVMGPVQNVAGKIKEGDYAGAAGSVVGMALPFGIAKGGRIPKIRPSNMLDATGQRAMTTLESRGVPINLAQRTGNPFIKGITELGATNPFSAGIYRRFANVQDEALKSALAQTAMEISPTGTPWKIAAGKKLDEALGTVGRQYKDLANEASDTIRELAVTKGNRQVVTGMRHTGNMDAQGNMVMSPQIETMASPVDYRSVKVEIKPIIESIEHRLRKGQVDANPGFAILKQMMERGDNVPLAIALDDLADLNRLSNYVTPYARTVSQGSSAFGASALRKGVKDEIAKLGPEAQKAYEQRITGTFGRKATSETQTGLFGKSQINREWVGGVRTLTQPGDVNFLRLKWVAQNAPNTIPDIARSYLEDLLGRVTEGKVKGWKGAESEINKLGQNTATMLFGDQWQPIRDMFRGAAMISERVNPSGTGTVLGLFQSMAMLKNPATGMVYVIGPRGLAKLITSPNGAQMMAQGMTIPFMEKTAAVLASAMVANIGIGSDEDFEFTFRKKQ